MAQPDKPKGTILKGAVGVHHQDSENNAPLLDAQREKAALLILLQSVQTQIVSAADAMPAVNALGEERLPMSGDEQGPENIRTKSEILDYLNASFAHLGKAIDAIGDSRAMGQIVSDFAVACQQDNALGANSRGANSCL